MGTKSLLGSEFNSSVVLLSLIAKSWPVGAVLSESGLVDGNGIGIGTGMSVGNLNSFGVFLSDDRRFGSFWLVLSFSLISRVIPFGGTK